VAAKSHQRTGYLPVTKASFELTDKSGFYKKNPGTDVSVTQMIRKTTDKSRGVRLGNFVQIRTIIDEELEGVWSGKKPPRKPWTPPSSAATSSWSASRKPTKAD
jgi:sn-glycerol 3-phosphate transport system substrate-binding protein